MKIYTIIKIVIKLSILFSMIFYFGMDRIIIQPVSKSIFYLYELTMLVCIISFFATFMPKLRKNAYILFLMSFIFYLLMYNFVPEIIIQHEIDKCMDKGWVWDADEKNAVMIVGSGVKKKVAKNNNI